MANGSIKKQDAGKRDANSDRRQQQAMAVLTRVAATKKNPRAQQVLTAIVQRFIDRNQGEVVDLTTGPLAGNTDAGLIYVGQGLAIGRLKSLKLNRIRGAFVIVDGWDDDEDRDKWIETVNAEQVPFDPEDQVEEGLLLFQIPE